MVRVKSLEERLEDWAKQPGAGVTSAERQFIVDMRRAASEGVGYSWMQQMCQWEWDWWFEQNLAALARKRRKNG
jgi:hypothetical protein